MNQLTRSDAGVQRAMNFHLQPGEPKAPVDLRQLAVGLHQEFESLGLFADYGDMCLVMALALQKVFTHLRMRAVVKHCTLVIAHEDGAFLLGFQETNAKVAPDLIDAHAVCVLEGKLLFDFGLGQARKAWNIPVHDSAVAAYTPQSAVLATHFADHCAYVWMDEPRRNPRVRAITEGNTVLAGKLFQRWLAARNAPRCQPRWAATA